MNNKVKLWFALSLIIVFLAGLSGGILIDKLFDSKAKSKRRHSPSFPSIEMMAEELDLTFEQQADIRELFQKNDEKLRILRHQIHQQFRSLRSSLKDEMNDILDDNQQEKLEAMIEKYMSERTDKRGSRTRNLKDDRKDKGEQK